MNPDALTGPPQDTVEATCRAEHERNTAQALKWLDTSPDGFRSPDSRRAQVHATLAQAWATRMIAERRA